MHNNEREIIDYIFENVVDINDKKIIKDILKLRKLAKGYKNIINQTEDLLSKDVMNLKKGKKTLNSSQLRGIEMQRDKVVNILKGKDLNDIEKAICIYNLLIQNVAYDYDECIDKKNYKVTNHNLYGAMCGGLSVCDGFSQAFAYYLNALNVETVYIAAYKNQHAWNMIKLNNKWYNVDVAKERNYFDVFKEIRYINFALARHKEYNINNTTTTEGAFVIPADEDISRGEIEEAVHGIKQKLSEEELNMLEIEIKDFIIIDEYDEPYAEDYFYNKELIEIA